MIKDSCSDSSTYLPLRKSHPWTSGKKSYRFFWRSKFVTFPYFCVQSYFPQSFESLPFMTPASLLSGALFSLNTLGPKKNLLIKHLKPFPVKLVPMTDYEEFVGYITSLRLYLKSLHILNLHEPYTECTVWLYLNLKVIRESTYDSNKDMERDHPSINNVNARSLFSPFSLLCLLDGRLTVSNEGLLKLIRTGLVHRNNRCRCHLILSIFVFLWTVKYPSR